MSSVIVTLTMNPSVDITCSVKQVHAEDKLRCGPPEYNPGGGGINVSRVIKRLGGKTLAVYPSPESGENFLEKLLANEQVDCQTFEMSDRIRENFTVSEELSEKQYRFVLPGAELSASERKTAVKAISGCLDNSEYVIASGSLPLGVPDKFYAELASMVQSSGKKLMIDTAGEPLRRVMDVGVFLLKCNLREFQELCGRELGDENQIRDAAQKFIEEDSIENLVISLGAGGCFLINLRKVRHYRTPTVPIRSKVGAGDSMLAGIACKYVDSGNLDEAVLYGVATGAAAVMTPGTELCRAEDVERIYNQIIKERTRR